MKIQGHKKSRNSVTIPGHYASGLQTMVVF